jgi:hypothetical protein
VDGTVFVTINRHLATGENAFPGILHGKVVALLDARLPAATPWRLTEPVTTSGYTGQSPSQTLTPADAPEETAALASQLRQMKGVRGVQLGPAGLILQMDARISEHPYFPIGSVRGFLDEAQPAGLSYDIHSEKQSSGRSRF